MVKVNPQKKDLPPGFSAPADVFHSMNLGKGDIFENKAGISLKIEPTPFSDKLRVQAMEETELEKTTESILTDQLGLEEGLEFTKQYYPPETPKQYSIDFALPILRLALEPHGSHLWELSEGDEAEKERDLNKVGWDVLWFDENDLEHQDQVAETIRKQATSIMRGLAFREGDDGLLITKSLPNSRQVFEYELSETVNRAGLHEEISDIVVYDGEVVPRAVAELHEKLSS